MIFVAVLLLIASMYYVFMGSANVFTLIAAILLVVTNGYNLYSINRFYFNYENEQIKWRFPQMKTENVLEVSAVKKVKQEWFGVAFENANKETIKFSTDGLRKKDKQLVFEFF